MHLVLNSPHRLKEGKKSPLQEGKVVPFRQPFLMSQNEFLMLFPMVLLTGLGLSNLVKWGPNHLRVQYDMGSKLRGTKCYVSIIWLIGLS